MFTRPADLTDSDVSGALNEGWGLDCCDISYAAVGYGSHHWRATSSDERWFVTVDDLDTKVRDASEARDGAAARLIAALTVACSLHDAGLDFVVAPVSTPTGSIVHRIDDRFVVALYEEVDGETHSWGQYPTRAERLAVVDRVVRVHEATAAVAGIAFVDDFEIPRRHELAVALSDRDAGWGPGPYGTKARDLLSRHSDEVARVLARFDELALDVASRPERAVLTHGEPHRANTITTVDGIALIDWDTALLAPPERDLWTLIDEDPQIADDYFHRTGVAADDAATNMYRLWWDLCEISLYTAMVRAPHDDTDDVRVAWGGLRRHLDPARWHHDLSPDRPDG